MYEDFREIKLPLVFAATVVIADKYTTLKAMITFSGGEANIFPDYMMKLVGPERALMVSCLAAVPGIYLLLKSAPLLKKIAPSLKTTREEQTDVIKDLHYGMGLMEYLLAANNLGLTDIIMRSYNSVSDFAGSHQEIVRYTGLSTGRVAYILGIGAPLVMLWLTPMVIRQLKERLYKTD